MTFPQIRNGPPGRGHSLSTSQSLWSFDDTSDIVIIQLKLVQAHRSFNAFFIFRGLFAMSTQLVGLRQLILRQILAQHLDGIGGSRGIQTMGRFLIQAFIFLVYMLVLHNNLIIFGNLNVLKRVVPRLLAVVSSSDEGRDSLFHIVSKSHSNILLIVKL